MIELGIGRPPRRPEIRTDATSLAINLLTAAVGATAAQTWAAGAVEVAAGIWARTLSTAAVDGAPVGPRWLAETGRALARTGQAVYLLDVGTAGRVRLLRATITDVWGDGPDPADWWYRLTVTGPRSTNTVTAPAASVVHVRYATEAHSPARGVSPLQYAALTGTLTANLEQSLGFEAGGAVANLITLPAGFNGQPPTATDDDGEPLPQDDPLPSDNLAEVIRTAKGRTLLPETTADNWNGDPNARPPRRDFEPQRLGADPPQALIQLRRHVEDSVLACFGIPSPLGPGGLTDGTAAREGARRLWTMTIQPLGAVIAEELSRVLERPVSIEYGRPSGMADLAARARAVGALAKAGVSTEDAMLLTGWDDAS